MKELVANVAQYTLSDSKATDEVCVFDVCLTDWSRGQAAERGVETGRENSDQKY